MRKDRRSRACYLVLYLSLAQGALLADDSGNSPAQVLLQRTTLTVSDTDRSIRFYRDLLGFTVSSDSSYDTPALRAMFNIPPGSTPRLVLLDGHPNQARALGLVAASGLAVDAAANRQYAPALVLLVDQLDIIYQRMQDEQVTSIQAPTELLGFRV